MMSRKDYVAFAKMVNDNFKTGQYCCSKESQDAMFCSTLFMMFDMIDLFKADNPKFDADKFETACRKGI